MILSVETKFSKVGLQNFYWEFVSLTLTSLVAASHCDIGAWEWIAKDVVTIIMHSCNEMERNYLAQEIPTLGAGKEKKKEKRKKKKKIF
jgi:hypothetical protein